MAIDAFRDATARWHAGVALHGWAARLAISFGLAGFLSLAAAVSFPVPWTPVPFSLAPLAVLVVGSYQRPAWALLSVAFYLLAGAVGAPIFAEGASGWQHLVGNTSGYLVGYAVAAVLASWYVQRRRRLLPAGWTAAVASLVALLVAGGIVAVVRLSSTGTGFAAYGESYVGWAQGASIAWAFVFLTAVAAVAVAWALLRVRGQGLQALNLYLVFLAAIGILHTLGVAGLIFVAGLAPVTAIIVGSVVFLPFDIIKAGLAVAATLPFLPAPAGVPADDRAESRSHA